MLLVSLVGCAPLDPTEKTTVDAAHKPKVAKTQIERGPVKVMVEVRPAPARLSDEPKLTLLIEHQQGVTVEKLPFGEAIGDFVIRDFHEPIPETKGDRQILRQVYTLEPTRSGTLRIDPVRVTFTDSRSDGDGKTHTVETEPVEVEITSVLESGASSLEDLQGMLGPQQLPPRRSNAYFWLMASVLIAIFTVAVVWIVRRRRQPDEEKQLTPQEMAYLELEKLLNENLGEADVKLFYVRLTGIVRHYIERTTNVHAPEQTTEEFLREIGDRNLFSRDDESRLKAFLESADIVKFAAHQPTAGDVEQAFERAKIFVGLESQQVAA